MNINDRPEWADADVINYKTVFATTAIAIGASLLVYTFTGQAPAVVPYVQYGIQLYCQVPKDNRLPIRELINANQDGNTIVITCKGD